MVSTPALFMTVRGEIAEFFLVAHLKSAIAVKLFVDNGSRNGSSLAARQFRCGADRIEPRLGAGIV